MRRPGLRSQSVRVAFAATLVVGLVWTLISAAVVAFATIDLTNQIDARLDGSFNRLPPPGVALPPQVQLDTSQRQANCRIDAHST